MCFFLTKCTPNNYWRTDQPKCVKNIKEFREGASAVQTIFGMLMHLWEVRNNFMHVYMEVISFPSGHSDLFIDLTLQLINIV